MKHLILCLFILFMILLAGILTYTAYWLTNWVIAEELMWPQFGWSLLITYVLYNCFLIVKFVILMWKHVYTQT